MQDDLETMIQRVQNFCEERDWDQFHSPKELAIGMVTESSELLDIFRFKTDAQIQEILSDSEKRAQVEDELADVLFFILRFAQRNEVSLPQALNKKMAKNAAKYPLEKARSSNKKYTEI